MSRKNEIKKDIWKILREVYGIAEDREITDKQNEFLNRTVCYLDENISLRRKGEKHHPDREIEDLSPLERPVPVKKPEPTIVETEKKKSGPKPKVVTPKLEAKPVINISALPEHLRKYVKS